MEDKAKRTDFREMRKGAETPLWIYPSTHLDRLLNDLQGNSSLMFEDEGLARFDRPRLRRIRADALAQAAAALIAAAAVRQAMRAWAADGWRNVPAGSVLREHLVQLRREARRWRQLAEYAARYLAYPRLARLHARSWLARARKGDHAESLASKAGDNNAAPKKRRRASRRARGGPIAR
ncbi:hypothetical protein RKE25_18655 [Dyella sp. BiH032]|uniref:hypothetical protein n=1 Tax=Dyella sp. BiH032 TaxID=3075430 RepID=UPI0028933B60|nr:hypothetical protein [Dyella sp. BiH032]WNL45417.1 hypothetical protein RKE25_18655 [Dyella sp. BiH032]